MQKKQICPQLLLFTLFLAAGGLISAMLRFELTYDLLLYHHYNGFAFLNDRLTTDIAPASVATYYNPLLDAALYLLNDFCKENTTLYCFITGLPFGFLMFVLFKISLLFFDFKTIRGKCCCAACLIIASTGVATWFQIGTCSHEIFLAALVLCSLYLLLKYPELKAVYLPAGFLLGAAAGFKLTAAIYCVSTGITLILSYKSLSRPIVLIALFTLGGLLGYLAVNGFWAAILWQNFENPVFPFWNKVFKSPYYLNQNYVDMLHLDGLHWYQLVFLPFYLIIHPFSSPVGALQELTDFRLAVLFIVSIIFLPLFILRKIIVSPLTKKTALWLFVSYLIWLGVSANLRFIIPIEAVGAVILTLVFANIKKPVSVFGESLYYASALIALFVFVSTVALSAPWGKREQTDFLKEKINLPENTVLEIYRFPLAGIAAEIARDNPTTKIILMSPSDEQWNEWDLARIGKTNEKRERLIKTAKHRAALYQDAFGLVTQENPQLRQWNCRALKIPAHLKSILFSNVKLCLPPETKEKVIEKK